MRKISGLCGRASTRTNRGFIALVSVVLLALGVLTFCLATESSVITYADRELRTEYRIQAQLNMHGCLDTAELMYAADYFILGQRELPEFGCTLKFTNDMNGSAVIQGTSTFNGVSWTGDTQGVTSPGPSR